jgi:hypothetical protein
MAQLHRIKDILDWGKRIQFVFQVATLLLSASVVGGVRATIDGTHIPVLWRAPIYLFSAGMALLLFSSIGRWWSERTIGHKNAVRTALREARESAAYAAVLNDRAVRAKELVRDLEAMWHHWNNAGETLVHPLTPTCDPIKDSKSMWKLIGEARDFKLRYADHLSVLKADFPEFISSTVTNGYPSSREYVVVLSDLKEHAVQLEETASRTWDKY